MKERKGTHFPEQYLGAEDLPGEVWRSVIYHGKVVPKYFVSNYGGVKGPRGKRLIWNCRDKKAHNVYPHVSLHLPLDFFGEYKKTRTVRHSAVHILVANAFLPLTEDTLPQPLKGYGLRQDALDLIRELLIVDHIDDNKANPRADNLRYTSLRRNNVEYKKKFFNPNTKQDEETTTNSGAFNGMHYSP